MRTSPPLLRVFTILLPLTLSLGCSEPGGEAEPDAGVDATPTLDCEDVDCPGDLICHHGSCYETCESTDDCPDDHRCHQGRCVPADCEAVGCPDDQACWEGACYPGCDEDTDCEEGLHCREGACVDPCETVDCADDQTCYRGVCYQVCDEAAACAEDDRCHEGRCTPDGCDAVDCRDDETCYRGVCYPACTEETDCDEPHTSCVEDACIDEPCDGMQCPADQTCYRGVCYQACTDEIHCEDNHRCWDEHHCAPTDCEGVDCDAGQTCYRGVCYPTCSTDGDCEGPDRCLEGSCVDPCEETECPTGQDCYQGSCFENCEDHGDCQDDYRCVDGQCLPLDCEGVDCPDDQTCLGGVCAPECNDDGDCADDEICHDGACLIPDCQAGAPGGDTTCPGLPAPTVEVTDVADSSATYTGALEMPPVTITNHGFCWDDEPDPAADDANCESLGAPTNRGPFELTATGLDPGTEYFVQAYADADNTRNTSEHASFTALGSPSAQHSSITGESGAVADGNDQADVTIELADEIGQPLPGITPQFSAAPDDGNSYLACTDTNADGIADCAMTATEPGDKTLEITDPVETTGETIEFFALECDPDGQPFGGGDGSESDPWTLCSPDHLAELSGVTLSEAYALASNLDMSGIDNFGGIGRLYGRFDGNGRTIEHLAIERPADDEIGLFGELQGGNVEDLTLRNASIEGRNEVGLLAGQTTTNAEISHVRVSGNISSDGANVGGLVGQSFGTQIHDAKADIDIEGTSSTVGGLIGRLYDGNVVRSHARGTLNPTSNDDQYSVGGLVGLLYENSSITKSYATSDIEAPNASDTGGLAGTNHGTITHSYALGSVETEDQRTGGLVGSNSGPSTDGGTIEQSYAAGEIVIESDDTQEVGGFIGVVTAEYSILSSYYDQQTTNQDDAIGNTTDDGVEGMPTDDFDESGNFDDWDFNDVWIIGTAPDGETRPVLLWQLE